MIEREYTCIMLNRIVLLLISSLLSFQFIYINLWVGVGLQCPGLPSEGIKRGGSSDVIVETVTSGHSRYCKRIIFISCTTFGGLFNVDLILRLI